MSTRCNSAGTRGTRAPGGARTDFVALVLAAVDPWRLDGTGRRLSPAPSSSRSEPHNSPVREGADYVRLAEWYDGEVAVELAGLVRTRASTEQPQ